MRHRRGYWLRWRRLTAVLMSLLLLFLVWGLWLPAAYAEGVAADPEVTAAPSPEPEEEPFPLPPLEKEPEPMPSASAEPSPSVVPTPSLEAGEEPETEPAAEAAETSDDDQQRIIFVNGMECVDGEVIVKFKDKLPASSVINMLTALDSDISDNLPEKNLVVTAVPEDETVESFVDVLEALPNVEYAQPNYVYRLAEPDGAYPAGITTDDTLRGYQWYLDKIGIRDAWDITMGVPDVRVAVLDTGIDLSHPEFEGQIAAQKDVVDKDDSADDDNGHGTHVAGIIAARANNNTGIAGVAPGVKLIIVDVFGPETAATSDIIEGIDFAVSQGADVINMSFGGYGINTALEEAINNAAASGVVCVAAAGNDNTNSYHIPSDFEACISVIATDWDDNRASYSNYGSRKDISAPGGDNEDIPSSLILSTYLDGGYMYMGGTSQAAPIISGVAALMLAANPDLSVEDVKGLLYGTAVDLGPPRRDSDFGFGRVDAASAVSASLRPGAINESGSYDLSLFGNGRHISIHSGLNVTLTNTGGDTYRLMQITCGENVSLTLDGVNIDTRDYIKHGVLSFTGGDNRLVLKGRSMLKSGNSRPGIWVGADGSLTILGDGALDVSGGAAGGAGIGAAEGLASGDITIESGTINAVAGVNSAGIGSHYQAVCGEIRIEGGSVTAAGGQGGAGIGGGYEQNGGSIFITGGSVTAAGGRSASGIGGGDEGAGGIISITGGTVVATGGEDGAGIGGGDNYGGGGGDGGIITITDAMVFASGGARAAGIGGGNYGSNDTVVITNSTVTAQSGGNSAGIGGGWHGDGGIITIVSGTVEASGRGGAGIGGGVYGTGGAISILGGQVTASGITGAGIGGGRSGDGGTITISGGDITAFGVNSESNKGSAGIGGGESGSGGTITITGGTVGAYGADLGAGIGCGSYSSSFSSTLCDIRIEGGLITAVGGVAGAGIGTGSRGRNCQITIIDGVVSATGGIGGAGIGGAHLAWETVVIIEGGNVTAAAGPYNEYYGAAAGIGSGRVSTGNGRAGSVTISGGTVSATGADMAAGIGSGLGDHNSDFGTITISGGVITAEGGLAGAGIGSGALNKNGQITIHDGQVIATGGVGAAGIGGGYRCSGGRILIEGGLITSIGGDADAAYGAGAGLGSGTGLNENYPANGGEITITGGTVLAMGGDAGSHRGGAGVGGGAYNPAGDITVSGGLVFAQKGGGAPYDIGCGHGGTGGTLALSGDTALFLKTGSAIKPQTGTHVYITEQTASHGEAFGHVLPAAWEPPVFAYINAIHTFEITYDANGGSGIAPTSVVQYKGTEATVASGSALVKNGLGFLSWNTQPDGLGQTYVPGDTYVFADSVTLFALYEDPVRVSAVTLSHSEATIFLSESITLTATVTPNDATYPEVAWTSSDNTVAVVDQNGTVTAVSEGSAVITATADGVSDTCGITVEKKAVADVALNQNSAVLTVGEALTLTAAVTPNDATYPEVTWTSSDDTVAAVDQTGTVTAVSEGSATITATADGVSASCGITVEGGSLRTSFYTIDRSRALIYGVADGTSVAAFKSRLDNTQIKLYDAGGQECTDGFVGTGMSVRLVVNDTILDELRILILGDISGDGVISVADYVLSRLDIMALKAINGIYAVAGDVNCDGTRDIEDYLLIRLDILGSRRIND